MLMLRRAVLALPLLGMRGSDPGEVAMLRPGVGSQITFTRMPDERLAFRAIGLEPAITLPAARARRTALLPIAGRQVAVLAFGADPSADATLDLAAIVGWDGARLRVLALEVLRWQAADGGGFSTRLTATGDRTRLLLRRDAAAPRGALRWQRESWTDVLAWHDGAALADDPVRAPLPQSWQARLAAARARVAGRLARPCADVSDDLIGLLAPPALPPVLPPA